MYNPNASFATRWGPGRASPQRNKNCLAKQTAPVWRVQARRQSPGEHLSPRDANRATGPNYRRAT
eukprot:5405263-Pyramimonas_sp.AAC.2